MPRAGLNRERVVDEATAVADAVGFDRLSLAAVAERTGVRLPSLYKHIESLDGLRRDVAVRALEELAATVTPAVGGGTGADGLRALAGAYRDYARQHPGRYAATVRAPRPDDEAHAVAAEAAWIAERLRAEVLLVPDAGHYPQTEAPEIVNPALVGFCASVAPRA